MVCYTVYVDGSCLRNPGGPGGWAAIIMDADGYEEIKGHCQGWTTNNRMEMTAAIKSLEAIQLPSMVDVYTDSSYLRDGAAIWSVSWAKRGYKRKVKRRWVEVPNADLWAQIRRLCDFHRVRWHWIRGHNGNTYNERCDELAHLASSQS